MIEIIVILILTNFMQIIFKKDLQQIWNRVNITHNRRWWNLEEEKILKIIFEAREEELAKLDQEDEMFMGKDEANRNKKYCNLQKQLEKIPYGLYKIKDSISKSVEEYVETIDYENAYFNEKYYLNGLKDGIKLISEIKQWIEKQMWIEFYICFFTLKNMYN